MPVTPSPLPIRAQFILSLLTETSAAGAGTQHCCRRPSPLSVIGPCVFPRPGSYAAKQFHSARSAIAPCRSPGRQAIQGASRGRMWAAAMRPARPVPMYRYRSRAAGQYGISSTASAAQHQQCSQQMSKVAGGGGALQQRRWTPGDAQRRHEWLAAGAGQSGRRQVLLKATAAAPTCSEESVCVHGLALLLQVGRQLLPGYHNDACARRAEGADRGVAVKRTLPGSSTRSSKPRVASLRNSACSTAAGQAAVWHACLLAAVPSTALHLRLWGRSVPAGPAAAASPALPP